MDEFLDPRQFDHFEEIHCDRCGGSFLHDPDSPLTGCFSCEVKFLKSYTMDCCCGWSGKFFDLDLEENPVNNSLYRACPECGLEHEEPKNEPNT